ncbi:hypothetical protein R3X27_07500 [Tropicimonas sp. TH_r6]|uniref:hypothetical protein n=1 Tax=Tropicimonas sp. TH_r6 TaxID=3082085 RepID=UPI0029551329|nr:hypothetical protein [Tropicimonas sp. TH_r6]MDV7142526.1 hypothetical protein [Tropicimonas sp. TH_r6]
MKFGGLAIAGALFYAAPIGAGLTGAPYIAALAFAGLFFLWVMVMKSEPFRDGPAMILPTLMIHFALASACLGLGHLLRALLGIEATAPLAGWLGLGLGGIALGRILWVPKKEAEIEAIAETALKKLNDFAEEAEVFLEETPDLPLLHPTEAEAAALAQAFGALDALPAEVASEDDIRRILTPLEAELRPHILLDALLDRAARTRTRRDRRAGLLLASETGFARAERGTKRMAAVFEQIVEAADVITLAQYLLAARDLLRDDPSRETELPALQRLLDISEQIEGEQPDLAEELVALAQQIEDIRQEDEHE